MPSFAYKPADAVSHLNRMARLASVHAPAQTLVDLEFLKIMIQNRIGLHEELTLMDWFCGAGGSSQGAHAVPGIRLDRAANHWKQAINTHQFNFPETDHWRGDICDAPVDKWPICTIFWASPECPNWSNAKGKKATYQHSLQGELFDPLADNETEKEKRDAEQRSRALMDEVPAYLEGVIARGKLVLAGVVENVINVRAWDQWDRWLRRFHNLGYKTKVIALNSAHAQPALTPHAPQSRDRLYVAYWHKSLARDPDFDKWLRPVAYCPAHGRIQAVQVFKRPGNDMGRYRAQYYYVCPKTDCGNTVVEPPVVPAAACIDWTDLGTPLGERTYKGQPGLAPKTMARIEAGLQRYAMPIGEPMITPTGGTWRDSASRIMTPMPTRTTRESDGLAVPVPAPFLALLRSDRARTIGMHNPLATIVADGSNHGLVIPPLVIPMEGREGKDAVPVRAPLRTQTTRQETGLAFAPFVTELRGGASDARAITESLATVTASGNHHGVTLPPGAGPELLDAMLRALLTPYYGNGTARPASQPVGAIPTHDRYGLVQSASDIDILDVLFRMLKPEEIATAMAFLPGYEVLGKNNKVRVRQYGNAVTPPAAEVILNALVEAISGTELERWPIGCPYPETSPAAV
ncbi:DNA cytosine methyltransferase (plasmid) [Nocardia sp. CA-084685]|uniref:DNA cytosine methyltransferase n=1 Tax=Nocardia sp. CA-084685 TaxID=3239970 RepID=UPI003D99FFD2